MDLYQYRAIVTKVYDGDTITVNIDLGLKSWRFGEKIRLYGIDTPEIRGPERAEGLVARDALREMILNREVNIKTYRDKKGKYGRWLGVIELDGVNINEKLVMLGFAVRAEY